MSNMFLSRGTKKPAWANTGLDHETLIEITRNLTYEVPRICTRRRLKIGDSRSFSCFCVTAAEMFQKQHQSDDPEYWKKNELFLDKIMEWTNLVVRRLWQVNRKLKRGAEFVYAPPEEE